MSVGSPWSNTIAKRKDRERDDSIWALRVDIVSAKALLWIGSAGRKSLLRPGGRL